MLVFTLFISFIVACAATVVVIRTQHLHAAHTGDNVAGVQKFHQGDIPRIGGVPILAGFLAAAAAMLLALPDERALFWCVMLSALPVFIAGLLEDITKAVRPLWRLLAAFVSGLVALELTGYAVQDLGFGPFNQLIQLLPWLAPLITVFAVGGVCHAVNIIDGYNGLMAGVVLLIVGAIAFVCVALGDIPLLLLCMATIGAVLGFMVWNFPRGLIFAGDAGAYLLGFMVAELCVLLLSRHVGVVSPWFALLILIYPVFETCFSVYRKKFLRQMSPGLPDGLHLHMLVYKRLVRWMVGAKEAKHVVRRNSMTAPYLWAMALFSIVPALVFWRYELGLMLSVPAFVCVYLLFYRMVIRFKSPKVLLIKKSPG